MPKPDVKKIITAADKVNQKALKALKEGKSVDFIAARSLVLIGDDHDKETVDFAKENGADRYAGTITIKKGSVTKGAGTLTCSGLKANRAEFEGAIARISKKDVVWV